ncbi:MAG: hypothetical protein IKH07_06315 [Oscillospiraceae bacterium]|nr:hypothetical protein [Oscillospiraceae bacterium]
MNGIQTSRSVYYSLLIVCMAAALLTVFLPFAILNNCYFYIEEQLQGLGSIPLSALSYLHPGRIGRYFRGDYTNYTFVLLLNLVLGAFAVLLQLLSIRRVLEALKWEEHRSQELSLGGGPIAGLLLCGMQIASSLFLRPYQERFELPDPSLVPTVWPFLGVLLHLCAMRLAKVLNRDRSPQNDSPAD